MILKADAGLLFMVPTKQWYPKKALSLYHAIVIIASVLMIYNHFSDRKGYVVSAWGNHALHHHKYHTFRSGLGNHNHVFHRGVGNSDSTGYNSFQSIRHESIHQPTIVVLKSKKNSKEEDGKKAKQSIQDNSSSSSSSKSSKKDDYFSTTKPIIEEINNFYPTSSKSLFNNNKNSNNRTAFNTNDTSNSTVNNNNTITTTTATSIASTSYIQTDKKEVVGIGGKGGIIYDVNKLKSNLVQKSIKQFKNELLQLLISPPPTSDINGSSGNTISSLKSTSSSSLSKSSKKDDLSLTNLTQKKKNIPSKSLSLSQSTSSESMSSSSSSQTQQNDFIDEKISALVSTNPVSTTTDSNLLEGEWDFAYSTNNAMYILKDSRNILSKKRQLNSLSSSSMSDVKNDNEDDNGMNDQEDASRKMMTKKWKLKPQESDKFIITSNTRYICLENLEDDEDPYMIDKTTYLDGVAMIERRFKIVGLTRTNLEVQPVARTQYILGKRVSHMDLDEMDAETQPNLASITTDLQFIYLDSDLCITMIGDESGILNVYTKNAEWRESRKKKSRVLKESMIRLSKIESPFHLRRKLVSLFRKSKQGDNEFDLDKLSEEEYQILLRRVYADKESKLMALRLGDVGNNNDDEDAWEGDEDPFVHLTADERQEIMKQMSIEEITEAGSNHKRLMMKLDKKKGFKRQKKFKRPSFGWEGEGKRQ